MTTLQTIKAIDFYKAVYQNDFSGFDKNELKGRIVFENILIQMYNEFGISEDQRIIASLKRDLLVMQAEMAISGDKSLKARIAVKEREIKSKTISNNNSNISSFYENCSIISKHLGFQINSNQILLIDFLSHLKTLEKTLKHGRN